MARVSLRGLLTTLVVLGITASFIQLTVFHSRYSSNDLIATVRRMQENHDPLSLELTDAIQELKRSYVGHIANAYIQNIRTFREPTAATKHSDSEALRILHEIIGRYVDTRRKSGRGTTQSADTHASQIMTSSPPASLAEKGRDGELSGSTTTTPRTVSDTKNAGISKERDLPTKKSSPEYESSGAAASDASSKGSGSSHAPHAVVSQSVDGDTVTLTAKHLDFNNVDAIPVLGLPVLNRPDLLAHVLSTIDFPVNEVVIVHNQMTGMPNKPIHNILEAWCSSMHNAYVRRLVIHVSPVNLGVSGAWNYIITRHPAPWWLFTQTDISYRFGALSTLLDQLHVWTTHKDTCLYKFHGYASFVVTRKAIETVGLFDENFWPAYAEDCDYDARLYLKRKTCPTVFTKQNSIARKALLVHGDPYGDVRHKESVSLHSKSQTGHRATAYTRIVRGNSNNFDYLIGKWGKMVCQYRKDDEGHGVIKKHSPIKTLDNIKQWELIESRRKKHQGPTNLVTSWDTPVGAPLSLPRRICQRSAS